MRRIWKPALGYIALYVLAMVFGFALSDAVHSSVLMGFWVLAPIVCMAIVWHAYASGGLRPQAVAGVAASAQPGPAPFVAAQPPAVPRFSGIAIAGAVLALFGLLTILPILYFIGLNRVWNGTALPTDVIYAEPPLAFSLFMGALLVIGSGAPIGTTIFGALAIQRIKRSGGRIVGLPLAVADAFFFPLLLLGGLIAFLAALVFSGLAPIVFSGFAPPSNAGGVGAPEAFGTLIGMVVCFFTGRAAWRAIVGREVAGSPTRPQPPAAFEARATSQGVPSRARVWTASAIAILCVAAAVILVAVALRTERWVHKGMTSFRLGKSCAHVHQFGVRVGLAVWIDEGEPDGGVYSEHLPGYSGGFRLPGDHHLTYECVTEDGKHGMVTFRRDGEWSPNDSFQLVAGALFLVDSRGEKLRIVQRSPDLSGIRSSKEGLAEGVAKVRAFAESDETVKRFLARDDSGSASKVRGRRH